MANTAINSGTMQLPGASVHQVTHGLVVGDVIRLDAASFIKAKADSATNAEVVGIVTVVSGVDDFTFLSLGKITGLSGLSAGSLYFLSPTTAGALTTTEPTTTGHVSKPLLVADSTTTGYFYNYRGVIIAALSDNPGVCDGRLTLTSGTPVTTADVTGATTIYFTPYKGNRISLRDSSGNWNVRTFSEISLALGTLTSGLPYDVFCYDNAGAPTLEFLAWTNGTTRATALALQDGMLVKSGAATRRYLGTFYTTATTTTEDSKTKRFLYNYYNRIRKQLVREDTTASWTVPTGAWRYANNSAANRIEVMQGWAESYLDLELLIYIQSGTVDTFSAVNIAEDSNTGSNLTSFPGGVFICPLINKWFTVKHAIKNPVSVGFHYYAWIEYVSSGTTTVGGNVGSTGLYSGMLGSWEC